MSVFKRAKNALIRVNQNYIRWAIYTDDEEYLEAFSKMMEVLDRLEKKDKGA